MPSLHTCSSKLFLSMDAILFGFSVKPTGKISPSAGSDFVRCTCMLLAVLRKKHLHFFAFFMKGQITYLKHLPVNLFCYTFISNQVAGQIHLCHFIQRIENVLPCFLGLDFGFSFMFTASLSETLERNFTPFILHVLHCTCVCATNAGCYIFYCPEGTQGCIYHGGFSGQEFFYE